MAFSLFSKFYSIFLFGFFSLKPFIFTVSKACLENKNQVKNSKQQKYTVPQCKPLLRNKLKTFKEITALQKP